jgi:hypothetical protein
MSHAGKYLISPWGERAEIDCGIVTLIELLWRLHIPTMFSCENLDGWAYVMVPDMASAERYRKYATYRPVPPKLKDSAMEALEKIFFTEELEKAWDTRVLPRMVRCAFPRQFIPIVELNLMNACLNTPLTVLPTQSNPLAAKARIFFCGFDSAEAYDDWLHQEEETRQANPGDRAE